MAPGTSITQAPGGAWTVTVQQAVGREQRFQCADEEHARAFAQLFGAPDRARRRPERSLGEDVRVFRLSRLLARWVDAFAPRPAAGRGPGVCRSKAPAEPELRVCRTPPWHALGTPRWG